MGRFDWLEIGKKKENEPAQETQPRGYDAEYFLQEAEKKFNHGDFEQALKLYARALGQDPNLIDAWVGQVDCLSELDELNEARVWANKALEQFPNSAKLLSAKAAILAKTAEYEEAVRLSDRAISMKDPDKFIWLCRGFVLLSKDEKNAKYCFDRVLEGNPSDADLNLRIGACYLWHNKFSEAKACLDRALENSQNNPFIWYKLAQSCKGLGLDERAAQCYEECLRFSSEFGDRAQEELNEIGRKGFYGRLFSKIVNFWRKDGAKTGN